MNDILQPLYRPCALILSDNIAAHILLAKKRAETKHIDNALEKDFNNMAKTHTLPEEFYNIEAAVNYLKTINPSIKIHQQQHFAGILSPLNSFVDISASNLPTRIHDQTIYWLEPSREISFFRAAYESEDSLIHDLTKPIKNLIQMPFDFIPYVRSIYGLPES